MPTCILIKRQTRYISKEISLELGSIQVTSFNKYKIMIIYRYYLELSGKDCCPQHYSELLQRGDIHIFQKWSSGEIFQLGKNFYEYDYGGIVLVHDKIFATTETDRKIIVRDFALFMQSIQGNLNSMNVTKVEFCITTYLDCKSRFIVLTQDELAKLASFIVNVRIDILLLDKEQFINIIKNLFTEKEQYERLQKLS